MHSDDRFAGKTLVVITGPTASGKSALAIDVARQLATGIISADSRQIYRGIPIATAMPAEAERGGVPHYLLDMLPLDAYYSASAFESDALSIAEELWRASDYAIVCGGSMMYIDALCNGLDELPAVPAEIRDSLISEYLLRGDEWLRGRLLELDPDHYAKVDLNNTKRVIHAVELCLASGRPYSRLLTGERRRRPFRIVKFCLDAPREILFDRINRRVEVMAERGLEEEARRVWPLRHLNSLNTVGLKEMFAYIEGRMSLDEALAKIQKNTRVYAKKQLTWHRRDASLNWLDITSGNLKDRILDAL